MRELSPNVAALATELESAFRAAADPWAAAKMSAYMRDQFEFFGISSPRRAEIAKQIFVGRPRLTGEEALSFAQWCWEQDQREYHYMGCGELQRVAKSLPAEALPAIRRLIEQQSWWDTVDALASNVVGPLVAAHPELVLEMDRWVEDRNMWVARTAIIHQLSFGIATDADRLFAYCRKQAKHRDFFIRKAIGWALRQYARTDPRAVTEFLFEYRDILSPLSVREAAKHIGVVRN